MGKEKRTDYYAGFASALKATYDDSQPYMVSAREKILGEQPPRLDALILKCDPSLRLSDEVGSFFEEHNVLEFKGYGDGISINDFYRVQAYALLYMTVDRTVDEIPPSSVTVTIMQHRYPQAAFDLLQKRGCEIVERSCGVWEVGGQSPFRCQVVNVQELPETWYLFKLIVPGATIEHFEKTQNDYERAPQGPEKDHLRDVLRTGSQSNPKLFQEAREKRIMNEAVRIIFGDEIEETLAEERKQFTRAREESAAKMIAAGVPVKDIADWLSISHADVLNVAERRGFTNLAL